MASTVIEKDLYNGLFHVVHNPEAKGRQPRYKVNDTTPKGVTSILGEVLAKDFVGWALNCMEEALLVVEHDRDITPEDIKEAKGESTRRRDTGGTTGTEVHAMVELFLKGEDVPIGKHTPEAQNAFVAFVKWFDQSQAGVLGVEEVVYSDRFEYAGTYDCMLEIDGKTYLCDLKTTNASQKAPHGVYAEHFIQLGAYALAHEEQRLYEMKNGGTDLPEIEGLMVISAKKDGKLDIVTNEDLDIGVGICSKLFESVLELFWMMNEISTKLKGTK